MAHRWIWTVVVGLGLGGFGCQPTPESPLSKPATPQKTASQPSQSGPTPRSQNPSNAPAAPSPPAMGHTDKPDKTPTDQSPTRPSFNQSPGSKSPGSKSPGSKSSGSQSSAVPLQPSPASPTTAEKIQIDETICGTGGQEAYFETPQQEIYICKNQQQALTYIATPKMQGNSIFLPAQKVKQGKAIGYVATDAAKTYIVAEKGYQLQQNNAILASEKVVRRQMPQN